jgi:hypothetical protein
MNSSVETYGGQGNVPSTIQQTSHDVIPFTGLDVTLLVAGAILLIVAGIALNHFIRKYSV